jgi:hypothetical protein
MHQGLQEAVAGDFFKIARGEETWLRQQQLSVWRLFSTLLQKLWTTFGGRFDESRMPASNCR